MRLLHACVLFLIALALWVGCGGSGSSDVIADATDSGADVTPPVVTPGVDSSTPSIADAPLGVTAVAGDGQVSVTWITPPNNGSAITGYVVTTAPGGITVLADAAATSATVTGLTNGSAYTFTVVAQNAKGNSKPSAPSNAVTPIGAPDAPTTVVASRGNAQAGVSWKAPASNGGSAITSYVVTSSPGGFTATVTAPATIATVVGLSNGTSYTFTVVAKNVKGTSPPSAASNAVTPIVPTAP